MRTRLVHLASALSVSLVAGAAPAPAVTVSTTRFAVNGILAGVTVASSSNAWAVGYAGTKTLTLHWDGRRWR